MGTDGHGRRGARWLVPAVAVAGAVAAVGARTVRARRAGRTGSGAAGAATSVGAGGAPVAADGRPSLPARQPIRSRRRAVVPAPGPDDLDIAARALTALGGPETPASGTPAAAAAGPTSDAVAHAAPTPTPDAVPAASPAPTGLLADAPSTDAGNGESATTTNGARAEAEAAPDLTLALPGAEPDPPPHAPPAEPGRTARLLADVRRHKVRLVAGVAVIGMGIGAAAAFAGVGADDEPARTEQTTTTAAPTTTTTVLTAQSAFPAAADHLAAAGSFSYLGSVSADDVSHIRPMLWLKVTANVTGEVSLGSSALHEVAADADGRVSETIAVGHEVWGRRADDAATASELGYVPVPELSVADGAPPARGAALLPRLLRAATVPADGGVDAAGRRMFTATLPGEALGPVVRGAEPVDARIVLTVDEDGAPARVEIAVDGGPTFHLELALADLGAPVSISPPA